MLVDNLQSRSKGGRELSELVSNFQLPHILSTSLGVMAIFILHR